MGKHEPMSAKAIANRIKAKGLQKISFYCQMCEKQCRDANGFKCHIQSEAHQRQALIVSENPERFVSEFSKEFMEGFMYLLRTRYRTKRVLANTVFQEYIKDREHVHMNGTRWTSLTEFANWLGENGFVRVEESERGVMVTYIDRDPETIKRLELEAKRAERAKEAAERNQREIEDQMEAARKVMRDQLKETKEAEPIPMIKVHADVLLTDIPRKGGIKTSDNQEVSNNDKISEPQLAGKSRTADEQHEFVEKPVFKVGSILLKTKAVSAYKPPPPRKRVVIRRTDSGSEKRMKKI